MPTNHKLLIERIEVRAKHQEYRNMRLWALVETALALLVVLAVAAALWWVGR